MNNDMDFSVPIPLISIIKHSYAFYKKNFLSLLSVSFVFFIPLLVVTGLDFYFILNLDFLQSTTFGLLNFLYLIAKFFIMYVLFLGMNAALINVVNQRFLHNPLTVGQALISGFTFFVPALFTGLLIFIGFTASSTLFLIPGLIFMGYSIFLMQALVINRDRFYKPYITSFKLSGGYLWDTLMLLIYYYAIVFVIIFIFDFAARLVLSNMFGINTDIITEAADGKIVYDFAFDFKMSIVKSAVLNLILIISQPLLQIALTFKYFNIKTIKDNQQAMVEDNEAPM